MCKIRKAASHPSQALDLADRADTDTAAIVHALLAIADAVAEANPQQPTGSPGRGLERPRTPDPASMDPQTTDEPRRAR